MAVGGVFLTYHNWLVVPEAARAQVLSMMHIQHTGVTKALMDARQLYFWLGKMEDIKMMVARCAECMACLPAQALEPQIATTATRPFEKFSKKARTTSSVLIGTPGTVAHGGLFTKGRYEDTH
jgi:hypothetical protein